MIPTESKSLVDKSRTSVVVIILNLNRPDDTIQCAESVLRSDFPISRIIVLDNGSSEDNVAKLNSKLGSSIEVLRSERNLGVAAGWNLAITCARDLYSPAFVFLLNNDALVDASVVGELVDFIQSHDRAGIAGPPIVDFLPPHQHQRKMLKNLNEPTIDYFLFGCALLIKWEVFESIGLFDEDYFAYGEETDLFERMKSSRWLPYYVPTRGKVYHKWAQTASMMSGFEVFHRARSGFIFRAKHHRGMRGLVSLASYFLHWELAGYLSDLRSNDKMNRISSRTRGIIDGLRDFRRVRAKPKVGLSVPSRENRSF
jgi:N-acetylglucosaminyl-diphospho-decaprenol L-rhamnosyltransferase